MPASLSRDNLVALGGGVLSGAFYLSVLSGIPNAFILAYLAQFPLILVGLGMGVWASVLAGLAAVVFITSIGGAFDAMSFALLGVAPSILLTKLALLARPHDSQGSETGASEDDFEWYPPGATIMWLTGFGVLIFIATLIVASGHGEGLEAMIREELTLAMGRFLPGYDENLRQSVIETVMPFFPSAFFVFWLVMMVVNAALAQWALVRWNRNLRPTPDITQLELPNILPMAIAAMGITTILGEGGTAYAARNLVVILSTPYFFLGLGVVHVLIRRVASSVLPLVLFYIFLLFLGWPIVMVAGLGFIDHWMGLRQNLNTQGNSEEG